MVERTTLLDVTNEAEVVMGNVLARKPLSKADALAALASSEEARVATLKAWINETLPTYVGRPLRFDLPPDSTLKTISALKEYYEAPELGWQVKHIEYSDQQHNENLSYIMIG